MARLTERIHAALETVGLVTVAASSIVLAVAELGPWWFEGAVVVLAIAAVYLVSAYKLRQLWLMRADTAQMARRSDRFSRPLSSANSR